MRKLGKGNGLRGITNLDPHLYTEDELEERRKKNKEFLKDINELQEKNRRELSLGTSRKE